MDDLRQADWRDRIFLTLRRSGRIVERMTMMGRVRHSVAGLKLWHVLGILLVPLVLAHGQRFEITPLVGGMVGGTWRLEQLGVPNFDTHLGDGLSFGIAGGVRFDGEDDSGKLCELCNSIEFRWVRRNTHLSLDLDPLVSIPIAGSSFHPGLAIDHFLGDFTHEWTIHESKKIHPFLTASLGAVRTATPAASAVRFVFGIGTGLKIFPSRHWGMRFQAEYLPIVMQASLQRVVCGIGCVVALDGGIMNQFQFSAGPSFRF